MFRYSLTTKASRGFSLLEIVVVIALLAISLVAIFSVVNRILEVENVTENDFVAKGLLTEGLALAEAKRNSNVASATAFYTNLVAPGTPADGVVYNMRIDYTGTMTTVPSLTNTLARLYYDPTTFYTHNSAGTASKFYRMLTTTYHLGQNGLDWLEVQGQVYWSERGKGSTLSLSSLLYNTSYP